MERNPHGILTLIIPPLIKMQSKKIKTESEENLFESFEEYLSKFKSPKKEEIFTDFIKYFHVISNKKHQVINFSLVPRISWRISR